ncbi:MAG TPA: ATP-binding cassette domain-containing protein, partial [Burkholderiales bacterium]
RHEMAMLFITHDLALVSEIADYVVVMRDGEIREQAPASQLFRDPRDAYTRALLACRPPRDRRPRRLPVIDDFMKDGRAPTMEERSRGLRGNEPALLEAKGLAKSFYFREGMFRQRELKAVKGASFRIAKGKTLGVVGESGSGKTTVALLVARLHQATGGEARFEGRDLLAIDAREAMPYKRRIQIVFQNPYASLNPRFTVAQILTEPMLIHGIGADDAERRAMAAELLRKVGLAPESLEKYPHEFSGGQRQRIAIARALTLRPELLICDESVSALDVSVQAQLLNLLQDLQDEYAMSYLFISHDLAVVRYMADEVMVMKDGEVVEIAGPDELYANPKHPYTRLLLSSIPGRAQ